MTVPRAYANNFVAVKYMLSSYRALSDGRGGIRHLSELLASKRFLYSDWKIVWTGTCATLRTAIDLFQIDSKSCISSEIRLEIRKEWREIKNNAECHPIYWKFLKEERDNIIHEYKWSAYEAWMRPDGTYRAPDTFLSLALGSDDATPVLLMSNGAYKGQNSLDLLIAAADWVEARIFGSIRRAGFDPDERRGLFDFRAPPEHDIEQIGLLGQPLSFLSESD